MNHRDSWGLFVDRVGVFGYTFRHDDGTLERLDIHQKPSPLLEMVRYLVRINNKTLSGTILDANRLPWCEKFHRRLVPMLPFREKFDKAYFNQCCTSVSDLPPDFYAWAMYDITFHVKQLVPTSPLSKFAHLVQNPALGLDGYRRLVREFEVDATVLRRFLGDVDERLHPLVEEAVVLAEYTDRMITHRTVWLSEEQLAGLTGETEWWLERCRSMEKTGMLRIKQGTSLRVGLGWAVDRLEAVDPTVVFRAQAGAVPIAIDGETRGVIAVDPRYPVDGFVHRREIASSMVAGLAALPPPECPAVPMASFEDMCTHVRATLAPSSFRVITISETGDYMFGHFPWVTAFWKKPTGELAVVLVEGRTQSTDTTKVKGVNGELMMVGNPCLYDRLQVITNDKFSNLHRYPKNLDVDCIVVVFDKHTDPAMYLEIERFSAPQKIYVKL